MPRQFKDFDELDHAVYFNHRERVRGKRDITKALQRSLFFTPAAQDVASAQFGSRSGPVTVVQTIQIGAGTPAGVIWEIGSSTVGAGLGFNSGDLVAATGNATGDTGAAVTLMGLQQSTRYQIAVAINPGTQKVKLYVDGDEQGAVTGVSAFPSGEYADTGAGRINGVNGTVTPRLGTTAVLSNVDIVSPVSLYIGQLPRGFEA